MAGRRRGSLFLHRAVPLEGVTQAGRTRNGLAYFEAFYTLVRAAGVDHLFVLIDQLEDLATAKNIPRSTRQREVGRFRDIFAETAGGVSPARNGRPGWRR